MVEIIIDKTSPSSYTTQAKLLLCQLLYDTISRSPKKFKGSNILGSFKRHPLINHPDLKLTEKQLVELVNNIMVENRVFPGEEGELPRSIEEYKDKVNLIIEVCNVYFFERIEEIEERIRRNKEVFSKELSDQRGD